MWLIDLGELVAKITVDDGNGISKLKNFAEESEKTDSKLKNFASTVSDKAKTAVLGLSAVVAASATALYGMASKSAEATDRIDKLSQKIGLSRESFQEMDFICSQSGMSVESLQGGIKTLTAQIDAGSASFDKLGVSITNADGSLRSQEEVMFDTLNALQGVENQTEKARIASELFGKAGTELMPMLNGATGSIDAMRQQAHELGLVLDDDAINSGVAFTDMVDQLQRSFGAVTTQIGTEVMPILMELGQFILDNMPTIQTVLEVAFGVIEEVVSIASQAIGILIDVIKNLVTEAQTEGTLFNAVWENIKIFIDATLNSIQILFDAFTALFAGDWETFWNKIKELLSTIIDAMLSILKNSVSNFVDAGKNIFTGVWDGLKEVWNNLKSWVEDKVNWMIEKLKFWKKSKSEMSGDSDGSHRTGLSEVPFDGYRAILHKGEMVLTQPEADRYKKGDIGNKTENFNVYIGTVVNKDNRTTADLMREMEYYRKSKAVATGGA